MGKKKKWRAEREYDQAVHKELAKEMGCEYVSGSLRELAMLQEWFEGSEPVDLYLLEHLDEPSKDRSSPAIEERAWNATTSEEVWIDTRWCRPLQGSGIPFVKEPKPRKYRRLTAFLDVMWKLIMYGLVDERDFIERYCFLKMRWDGKEIEHIYFNNKDCRKIFFQHKPQE
jgi:hypothetical protein